METRNRTVFFTQPWVTEIAEVIAEAIRKLLPWATMEDVPDDDAEEWSSSPWA